MFKNRTLFFILMMALLVLFAGCSSPNNSLPENGAETGEQSQNDNGESQINGSENGSENDPDSEETKTDSGTYVGLIDNNSIEIKISGVPEESSARAFRLGEEIREGFEERFGLTTGDEVRFNYIPKENEQPVIIEIEKIN
ncbi:MAG: hypothetical protein PHT78_06350 [Desulfitobacteriaceae bacterium]|nr:hypothetical protein [Desulfitobacteriaceae bacterium]MDD4752857.1 hypothetical protein [Desulfitobacteriaceae bacterium]